MSNTITSKVAGQLEQDNQLNEFWNSKALAIPLFDHNVLPITFVCFDFAEDGLFIQEADKSLQNFLTLDIQSRSAISHYVYKNCKDFLNEIEYADADDAMWKMQNEEDVWNFVHPTEIYIERRMYNDHDIYLHVDCECDWEQEHGLQLVFRQGKQLTRVSGIDGHLTEADAWGKPDEQDELLSQFKN